MAKCDTCGNDYPRAFTVRTVDGGGTFDSFECAIHALAPRCAHCGCVVIGHGVERDGDDGTIWCCTHCERRHGHATEPEGAR